MQADNLTKSKALPARCGRRTGRPTLYSLALAAALCDRLMDGESLRTICASEGMPGKSTVLRWADENAAFREKYTAARELQARILAHETAALRERLSAGPMPRERYRTARESLQDHLRRVGQLAPKRYAYRAGASC